MPVLLVKVALMSSSAFFMEAAAKTVTVFSCANADGRFAVANSAAKQAMKPASRCMSHSVTAALVHNTIVRRDIQSFEEMTGPELPLRTDTARLRRVKGQATLDALTQRGNGGKLSELRIKSL